MDIAISSIQGHGSASEEEVWLRVLAQCDVGHYLLADSTFTAEDKVSNKLRHVYWFPDQLVGPNDYVVLHTGVGNNSIVANRMGGSNYHYYWNLKNAVWNDKGDAAVLIEARTWAIFRTR